jgi:hypothetical protein
MTRLGGFARSYTFLDEVGSADVLQYSVHLAHVGQVRSGLIWRLSVYLHAAVKEVMREANRAFR